VGYVPRGGLAYVSLLAVPSLSSDVYFLSS
jgi:hypothetical protein